MPPLLQPGKSLPDITVPQLGGGELRLGTPADEHDWQIVVIYRGQHCPICKTYLTELERVAPEFAQTGVGIVAVSNAPFARPDLASLAQGLKFIRDNDYPIRGRLQTGQGAPDAPAEVH